MESIVSTVTVQVQWVQDISDRVDKIARLIVKSLQHKQYREIEYKNKTKQHQKMLPIWI